MYIQIFQQASTPSADDHERREEDIVNNDELSDLSLISNPFPDFDLDEILSKSPEGNAIKSYYEKYQRLSPKFQNELSGIIVRQLFPWLKSK